MKKISKHNKNKTFEFSKINPKKSSKKTKMVIFCILMFPIIFFCVYFAIQTYIRGSEKLQNLTHVRGIISGERIMKHQRRGKYRNYYEDVLVISIQGCEDELGYMDHNKSYSKLFSLVKQDIPLFADVYYDKSRQRIEDNVTLHTFDLSINGKPYIKIEDNKKRELIACIIFSVITLFLILLTYQGLKRINERGVID